MIKISFYLLAQLCLLSTVRCRSLDLSSSLVTSPSIDNASPRTTTPKQYVRPEIYEMRVDTNVSNRYARTLITSKVRNIDTNSQEAVFSIVTPDQAFISGFIMEIDGKQYPAHVKEKEEAKKTYEHAVSRGQAAAHVASSVRDSHRFTVSVNLEPESKAIFYLTYEELLERREETYEVVLNIHPGQLVDLKVQVNISEARPLKFVKVPSLRTGNEADKNGLSADPHAKIETINSTSAIVTFAPDKTMQESLAKEMGSNITQGIQGQFIVQYDVERDPQGGEVLVAGGYFVHFFAPEELPPLKKQVTFVLDTSGSMSGSRITQLKQAMSSILDELKPDDTLSIIEFNTMVNVWNIPLVERTHLGYGVDSDEKVVPPAPVAATAENINKSKQVIDKLYASGITEIYGALEVALTITSIHTNNEGRLPIIIFLTDGQANGRISDSKTITSRITEQNTKKVPIYTLSFGDEAEKEFLRKLSLKNQAFSRHIYEAADSFLQLRNFYKQISSPLLSNVTFKYVDKVTHVTKTHFPVLYRGGELMTAGIIEGSQFSLAEVQGKSARGFINLKPTIIQGTDSLERLWAYLSVKQYLEERKVTDNSSFTDKALELSLKYSFVTDVTSLVVVKPNASTAVDTEDATQKPTFQYAGGSYQASSMPMRPVAFSGSLSSWGTRPRFGGSGGYYQSYAPAGTRSFRYHSRSSSVKAAHFDGFRKPPAVSNITAQDPLPWLKGQNTIAIDSKIFSLGVGMKQVQGPSCDNSIDNKNGTCTLIFECPSMFKKLVDLNSLKEHFCEVTSTVAGVCCTIPSSASTSSTASPTSTIATI